MTADVARSSEKRFAKPVRGSQASGTHSSGHVAERAAALTPAWDSTAGEHAARLASTSTRVTRDSADGRLRWVAPSRSRTAATETAPVTENAPENQPVNDVADSPTSTDETQSDRIEPAPREDIMPVTAHQPSGRDRAARRAYRTESSSAADENAAIEPAVEADPFDDPFQDGTQLRIAPRRRGSEVQRTVARIVDPSSGEEIEAAEPRLTGLQEDTSSDLPPGFGDPAPAPDARPIQDALPPPESDFPSLEEQVAQGGLPETGPCPSPKDLKRIGEITDDITPEGLEFPQECTLGDDIFQPRSWAMTTFHWKASALCHKPLYFQQVQVERYGHTWPLIQPLVSGANFFLTFPILPYKIGLNPPWECMYTLGYYRPGSCAPYLVGGVPFSVRAGILEAGAWVGGVYLIP